MEVTICLEKLNGERKKKPNKSKKHRFRLGFEKPMNRGAVRKQQDKMEWMTRDLLKAIVEK